MMVGLDFPRGLQLFIGWEKISDGTIFLFVYFLLFINKKVTSA